jgi:hypothetical protein
VSARDVRRERNKYRAASSAPTGIRLILVLGAPPVTGAAAEAVALMLLAAVLAYAMIQPRGLPEATVTLREFLRLGAITVPNCLATATVALWLALTVQQRWQP